MQWRFLIFLKVDVIFMNLNLRLTYQKFHNSLNKRMELRMRILLLVLELVVILLRMIVFRFKFCLIQRSLHQNIIPHFSKFSPVMDHISPLLPLCSQSSSVFSSEKIEISQRNGHIPIMMSNSSSLHITPSRTKTKLRKSFRAARNKDKDKVGGSRSSLNCSLMIYV